MSKVCSESLERFKYNYLNNLAYTLFYFGFRLERSIYYENCLVSRLACINISFRSVYSKDKLLAETGERIEKGEAVQPKMTLEINHSIWLCTVGAGFGKKQWR